LTPPLGVAFSLDDSLLAAVGWDGHEDPCVHLWDVATGELRGDLRERLESPKDGVVYHANVESLAFTGDGKALASASRFGFRVRTLPDHKQLFLRDPDALGDRAVSYYRVATPGYGPLVAVASAMDSSVQIWDYTTQRVLREFKFKSGNGYNLALSPDGRVLATGERDILLWDVATATLLGSITDKGHRYSSYAFSANGRLIAATDYNSADVKVWDVFTREEVARFTGHTARATCIAFSPDGSLLASGSEDTTILLWDVSKLNSMPPATDPAAELTEKGWQELPARGDAGWQAATNLISGGERTIAFLKDRLKPREAADPDGVRKLLADLADDDFEKRQLATSSLIDLADTAEPQLRKALEEKQSPDVEARIKRALAKRSPLPDDRDQIREDRALYVLEQMDTKASRELLERIAAGVSCSRLTVDAKAALDRLKRQDAARKAAAAAEK
jgi:WD40 repeat protein